MSRITIKSISPSQLVQVLKYAERCSISIYTRLFLMMRFRMCSDRSSQPLVIILNFFILFGVCKNLFSWRQVVELILHIMLHKQCPFYSNRNYFLLSYTITAIWLYYRGGHNAKFNLVVNPQTTPYRKRIGTIWVQLDGCWSMHH